MSGYLELQAEELDSLHKSRVDSRASPDCLVTRLLYARPPKQSRHLAERLAVSSDRIDVGRTTAHRQLELALSTLACALRLGLRSRLLFRILCDRALG